MSKKFCMACGAELEEGREFCQNCGTRLNQPDRSIFTETAQKPARTQSAVPITPQTTAQFQPQAAPAGGAPHQAGGPRTAMIIGIAAAVVLVIVLVLFVVVPALNRPAGTSVPVSPSTASEQTTQTTQAPPVFPTVQISSQLPGDSDTADYGIVNLTDGRTDTAWNEGAPGDGTGEWVRFSASAPQYVTSVSIMGGFPALYKDGSDLYYKNSRPKQITISYDGGSEQFTMQDLRDQFQTFTLASPVYTTQLTITIDSAYAGAKYDDCCIAEVKIQ